MSYLAIGVPARIVRVSNTTLYRVAADYLGDALWWTRIAILNGIEDPWIGALTELKIPTPAKEGTPDGILGVWIDPDLEVVQSAASDVAQTAATLRHVQLPLTYEQVYALLPTLPTTLPSQPGVLWNNGGEIAIS